MTFTDCLLLDIIFCPGLNNMIQKSGLYNYLLLQRSRALSRTSCAYNHLWVHKGKYSVPISAVCEIYHLQNRHTMWPCNLIIDSNVHQIISMVHHTF